MPISSRENDRWIGQYGVEYAHLSFSFEVNEDSCKNPDYFAKYLRFNAPLDVKTGDAVTYVMLEGRGEKAERVLGFISARASSFLTRSDDGAIIGSPALEVAELAVAKGYERQGIAEALFDSVMRLVMEIRGRIGIKYIVACVIPEAVGFYRKMHMAPVAEGYDVPREVWNENCIPMYVKLPEQ